MNKSNSKTHHSKKGGINRAWSLSNMCGPFIENEEMDFLKDNKVHAFGNSLVFAESIASLGGADGVPTYENLKVGEDL
jgi:hypothetical protein